MSKGQMTQLEGVLTGQIWNDFFFKKQNPLDKARIHKYIRYTWMIGGERKTHLVKSQVISREGKIELENSHLATNIVKRWFRRELSMDTKSSRLKYDIYDSVEVCLTNR